MNRQSPQSLVPAPPIKATRAKALIIYWVVSALALSGVFADRRCLCPLVARSAICLHCGAVTLTLAHGPPIRLKSAYRVALSLVGVIASNLTPRPLGRLCVPVEDLPLLRVVILARYSHFAPISGCDSLAIGFTHLRECLAFCEKD